MMPKTTTTQLQQHINSINKLLKIKCVSAALPKLYIAATHAFDDKHWIQLLAQEPDQSTTFILQSLPLNDDDAYTFMASLAKTLSYVALIAKNTNQME